MKEDNNIEEIFRSSFGEFEVTPPPAVKQAVDRAIAAAPWYRRGFLWLLLLIPVAGIAVFLLWNSGSGSGQNDDGTQTAAATLTSGSGASSDSNSSSGNSGNDNSGASSASGQTGNAHSGYASPNTSGDTGSSASGRNDNAPGKQRATGTSSAKGSSGPANSGSNGKRGGRGSNRSAVYPMSGHVVEGSFEPASGSNGANTAGSNGGNSGEKGGSDNDFADPLALNAGAKQEGNPDPSKQDPPKTDPSKDDPAKTDPPTNDPPKTDSVKKPWKPDSTVKESLPGHNSKKKDDNGEKLWYASIYPGPQLSFNSPAPASYELNEKTSFRFSGEINRSVMSGYGLTSGLGYNSWSETFSFFSSSTDSAYSHTDSIPVFDPQNPDSILYYDTIAVYDYNTTTTASDRQTSVRTFFIPLYVSKQFALNDKWGLLTNAGAVFNFYKVTGDSSTTKDFGMSLSGRVHATYKWNNWMFSAGFGGGWDLAMPASYAGYDRKRYWITPQVGIHLTF